MMINLKALQNYFKYIAVERKKSLICVNIDWLFFLKSIKCRAIKKNGRRYTKNIVLSWNVLLLSAYARAKDIMFCSCSSYPLDVIMYYYFCITSQSRMPLKPLIDHACPSFSACLCLKYNLIFFIHPFTDINPQNCDWNCD